MKSLQGFLRPATGLLSQHYLRLTNFKQALEPLLKSVLIWHLSYSSGG